MRGVDHAPIVGPAERVCNGGRSRIRIVEIPR